MTGTLKTLDQDHDIDALVDEALRHPERAQKIKDLLKQRVPGSMPRTARSRNFTADEDSLWDNVPV